MKGKSHQSNGDLIRYLVRSIDFRIQWLHAYIKYNKRFGDRAIMAALGPLQNEELLCDCHQLLVTEREESRKQWLPTSVSQQVHTPN